jgi:hypothetical protein
MFNPSRDEVRELFFRAWKSYREGVPVAGMEGLALDVILQHPEYRAMLSDPERHRDRDYVDEANPFLHMSLHMALEEQLSIDQPPGVVQRFNALVARHGERHAALHDAIECLAEMVWRSQRDGTPPDGNAYLQCLSERARR